MSKGKFLVSFFSRAGIAAIAAFTLLASASAQTNSISGNTPGFIKHAQDLVVPQFEIFKG